MRWLPLVAFVAAGCSFADDESTPAAATPRDASPGPTDAAAPQPGAADSGSAGDARVAATTDLFAMAVTDRVERPALTAAQRHQAKGVNPANPARQSCMAGQCHLGNSMPFLAGLTVCADAACKAVAEGVEVRIATGDGKVYQAFTGADGNAWIPGSGGLAAPSRVAIRRGSAIKTMSSPLEDATSAGSCNMQTCHGADPAGVKPPVNIVLFMP